MYHTEDNGNDSDGAMSVDKDDDGDGIGEMDDDIDNDWDGANHLQMIVDIMKC